ncbi:DNA polymerase III subunit alpha [Bombilactobacillus thymidiniphilus]|uniref:DNA-directed DNA polymerase n=1 Tax=Bombilactobacillus thymidiniphilus TaxID=2923363 RepID=A0ABY4PDU0_9LACO|nr:DNA polymerase III subunit alpha [Bombilactobacillus thymidiniphilus]UQS83730.1 DNA polymerase III subunit alpha [Bombilactobacillus thymidiniphilus]
MTVQLQIKSSYSLLQSTIKLPELIQQAKALNYDSLALTDVNVTYGLIDFYKLAKKAGLHPILGMTLDVPGLLDHDHNYQLIVLAKNQLGYHNLLKLSSAIMIQDAGFNLVDHQNLLNDLALLIPGKNSELTALLQDNSGNKATNYLQILKQLKTKDLYIGLDLRNLSTTQIQQHYRLAQLQQLSCVVLDDIRYLQADGAFAHKVLQQIAAGEKITSSDISGDFAFRSSSEVSQQIKTLQLGDVLANTEALATQCQVEINFQRTQLPHFETPQNLSSIAYLTSLVEQGLHKLLGNTIPSAYQKRAQHELQVIAQMGYADYFLIVWDVIEQAHRLQIMTGPGRGSAAGSLVSYALQITQIDPLKYDLLFERFLNPERVDMPDIDLDIPDNRRDDLVHYMQQKYGDAHMAQIITFGTFAAKQSLRDVGRVFGLSQHELNRWSKAIPKQLGIDLKTAYQASPALQHLYQQSKQNQLIFKTALQIEGLPRHFSTHAAGIVLSAQPLENVVALQKGGSEETLLTQQTKNNVEALGLLKIDFLGLRNLAILAAATHLTKKYFQSDFDPRDLPLDDSQTLAIFSTGDTNGIFQFESAGIKNVLQQLKPDSFQDVVATNALYRPGPMKNIAHFIARKRNQEPITYPDDSLKAILAPTYGILVYQEQVMQVVAQMAGFSLAQADLLRRAMAKKDKKLMTAQKKEFIVKSLQNGYPKVNVLQVYDYIAQFANYGFNKSHAVAYSRLAYSLAYIKAHYPTAFYTALLNANLHNDQKINLYLQELRQRRIKILPPDVNNSAANFTITKNGLRWGLLFIKGIRRDLVDNIVSIRQEQSFNNLTNFLAALDKRFLKIEILQPLVFSGSLDQFNPNRRQLFLNVQDLVESLKLAGGSLSLFDVLKPKQNRIEDYSHLEKLEQENQTLGVYLSGHPVTQYQDLVESQQIKLAPAIKLDTVQKVLFFVKDIKTIRTKTGKNMAFLKGSDGVQDYSITVFPDLYKKINLQPNQVYVIALKAQLNKRRQREYIARQAQLAQNIKVPSKKKRLYVRFQKKDKQKMNALLELAQSFPGNVPVVIYFAASTEKFLLKKSNWINYNVTFKQALTGLVGEANFVYH